MDKKMTKVKFPSAEQVLRDSLVNRALDIEDRTLFMKLTDESYDVVKDRTPDKKREIENNAYAAKHEEQLLPWQKPKEQEKKKVVTCPKCGSGMVKRKSKYGMFYGCSRYPSCRGVRKIREV